MEENEKREFSQRVSPVHSGVEVERDVVQAAFVLFRMGDIGACLFADGNPVMGKKLVTQEVKKLLHQGREGSGSGHMERLFFP